MENIVYRFELKTNYYKKSIAKRLDFYGILILPIIIGAIVMYTVLQWRDEYFTIPFVVLVLIFVNLYFFYQKMGNDKKAIKLIIYDDYIQIMDEEYMYFNNYIRQLKITSYLHGKQLIPTIQINGRDFQGITLGLDIDKNKFQVYQKDNLEAPKYWLSDEKQSELLLHLLGNLLKNNPQKKSFAKRIPQSSTTPK